MSRPANLDVRFRILDAGREAIHNRGFHGCGVQDITSAAGVPKGSFYNYFDSKEAFAVEILEDYWSEIEKSHGPLLYDARTKPLERIVNYFRALSRDHEQRHFTLGCLIGNVSLELSPISDKARRKLSELINRWESALADCLREAQVRNEWPLDRDANDFAAVLIEAWEGAVMRGKVEQSAGPYQRFEATVLPRLIG